MIVIPMAGMSSRFFKEGYAKPKYMLEAHGETLFEHSVKSFEDYFGSVPFLFIVKDLFDTPKFIERKIADLGIETFHVVILDKDTRGQAETVTLGLEKLESKGITYDGPITVFNIDTFRPNFRFPEISELADGYLEVFYGEGHNWSFAKPVEESSTLVSRTAEKNPISKLCSTGLYHFKNKIDYISAYYEYLSLPEKEWEKGELYIAPLYNILISKGRSIHYHKIERDDVIFCGVPEEYRQFVGIS